LGTSGGGAIHNHGVPAAGLVPWGWLMARITLERLSCTAPLEARLARCGER
jgi:hypothetical protein